MNRQRYLDIAALGLSMPIGTDLVLHEESDPERVRRDGRALGQVIEKAARRWHSPLAVPLMDLRLEKIDLLAQIGISEPDADEFHFDCPIAASDFAALKSSSRAPFCAGSIARNEALSHVANQVDLIPIGMCIGPFSLVTRLMADPITASGLAGAGITPEDAPEVALLHQCLEIAERAVLRSAKMQIACGARALMVCEPAANISFISPRQIASGSDIFSRLVLEPNLRLRSLLEENGIDLIFHDCGELTQEMVHAFAVRLHPCILSLGSSRRLWEDAAVVPKDVVLYGNLPSKAFYSDEAMPLVEVERLRNELIERMRLCAHPFICGTECDVLFVPEAQESIATKVNALKPASPIETRS